MAPCIDMMLASTKLRTRLRILPTFPPVLYRPCPKIAALLCQRCCTSRLSPTASHSANRQLLTANRTSRTMHWLNLHLPRLSSTKIHACDVSRAHQFSIHPLNLCWIKQLCETGNNPKIVRTKFFNKVPASVWYTIFLCNKTIYIKILQKFYNYWL